LASGTLTRAAPQVLITVLANGGAATYIIEKLDLRDLPSGPGPASKGGALDIVTSPDSDLQRSSPSIAAMYSSNTPGSSAHGSKHMCGQPHLQQRALTCAPLAFEGSDGDPCRGVREKIHEFQRAGGVVEQFSKLDKTLGRVLINHSSSPGHSPLGRGHQSSPNLADLNADHSTPSSSKMGPQ